MNRFMTSRRLKALTRGWQDINKIFGRLNVLSLLSALGRRERRIKRLEPLRAVMRPEYIRRTYGVNDSLISLVFKMLNSNTGTKQVPISFQLFRSKIQRAAKRLVLFRHFPVLLLHVFSPFCTGRSFSSHKEAGAGACLRQRARPKHRGPAKSPGSSGRK